MANEIKTLGVATPEQIQRTEQAQDVARLVILGGLQAQTQAFAASESLQTELREQDLRVCALHQSDDSAANWLSEAGIDVVSLAAMEGEIPALPEGIDALGFGETEAMANRPLVRCVNGIRLGFVTFAEQIRGEFQNRADLLSLMAFDRVRMLINQCDHVIVLVKSGLPNAELPLPEWRARYRRLIDVGASVVIDTGNAKGWEDGQNGLIFYGLGSPTEADSLGVFLTLHRNGRLSYEARALERTAGTLDFSKNDSFKAQIDAQNRLFTNEKAYQNATDEMCKRLYSQSETAQKRGVRGLLSSHAEEEARFRSLLENESLRLVTLRAMQLTKAQSASRREIANKA